MFKLGFFAFVFAITSGPHQSVALTCYDCAHVKSVSTTGSTALVATWNGVALFLNGSSANCMSGIPTNPSAVSTGCELCTYGDVDMTITVHGGTVSLSLFGRGCGRNLTANGIKVTPECEYVSADPKGKTFHENVWKTGFIEQNATAVVLGADSKGCTCTTDKCNKVSRSAMITALSGASSVFNQPLLLIFLFLLTKVYM